MMRTTRVPVFLRNISNRSWKSVIVITFITAFSVFINWTTSCTSPKLDNITIKSDQSLQWNFMPNQILENDKFIRYLRDNLLFYPQRKTQLKNETRKHEYDRSQFGQSIFIDKILKNKTNGFFVSCGEWDGRAFSDSIFFAERRNWTGLLIEPNPDTFKTLLERREESYKINVCLDNTIKTVKFINAGMHGGISARLFNTPESRLELQSAKVKVFDLLCVPLQSILHSLDILYIDLLILDIENSEEEVLESFPFADFIVELVLIDFKVHDSKGFGSNDYKRTMRKWKRIQHTLESYEFVYCEIFPRIPKRLSALDVLYVKKHYISKLCSQVN